MILPIAVLSISLTGFITLIMIIRESVNYQKHYDNGLYLEEQGKYDEAISAFEYALKLYPEHSESLVRLAVLYSKKGDMERVTKTYSHLLEINDPTNISNMVKIHHRLADFYGAANKHDLAYLESLKLLEFEDNEDAKYRMAYFLAGCGEYDAASVILRQLSKEGTDKARIFFLLGLCYASKGWLNESILEFEKSYSENPLDFNAVFYLGQIYKDKMSVKAIEYFSEVIAKSKDKKLVQKASLLCGLSCIEQGFFDKAPRVLKVPLNDEDMEEELLKEIRYNLGWAFLLSGDIGNAVTEWGAVANMDVNYMDISELLKDPEQTDYESHEIEWRRYSANKNFKTAKDYINFPVRYDVEVLGLQFEKWKEQYEEKLRIQNKKSGIFCNSARQFSHLPKDQIRKIGRLIVLGLHYVIDKEQKHKDGVDFISRHQKDKDNKVLISFRTWTDPVNLEQIQEVYEIMKSSDCTRSILAACGEYREKTKAFAAEKNIKLINERQFTVLLKRL